MIELAYKIILQAFAGKKDKAGSPYIFHLERVAAPFAEDEVLFTIALLHDLLEDNKRWTTERLDGIFIRRVITAVDALTRRDGEDYSDFIYRVAKNEDARKVKLSDLKDNMNLTRIKRVLNVEDMDRTEKYHRAYLLLSQG